MPRWEVLVRRSLWYGNSPHSRQSQRDGGLRRTEEDAGLFGSDLQVRLRVRVRAVGRDEVSSMSVQRPLQRGEVSRERAVSVGRGEL